MKMHPKTKKQIWKGIGIMVIGFIGFFIPLVPGLVLVAYGFYNVKEALKKMEEYI